MTTELTLAANGVSSFMEFAVSRGASRRELMRRSGIEPAELVDRDNRVPFHKYVALMRAGQQLCGDPALALHFGEAVDCSEIAIPAGGAANLDDAVKSGNRYARLVVDVVSVGSGDRFALERQGGQLWMVDHRANPNEFPELTESGFARMVCSTRRVMGDTSLIKAVLLTHGEPAYRAEYDRIFRVPVTFGSDRNALQIDEHLMARFPFPSPPKYVTGVLHDHAEGLLRKLHGSQSTRGRVETLLVRRLGTGDGRVDVVARQLGLSRQTLFRKLSAEGTTFQQVLDELRHRLALHYLVSEKATVQRAAALLGFSDGTALSRAFKRWTGVRPREYLARSSVPSIARRPRPSPSARG